MPNARNIELKARLANSAHARKVAERIATSRAGIQRQRDTYFAAQRGRLKLREIDGQPAQLIVYRRPNVPDAKASDYQLLTLDRVETAQALGELLAAALGISVVVDKTREIFLHQNVRIHLDEVSGLGSFLEFEAVVGDGIDDRAARDQLARLQREFGITAADLMSESYSDMLLKKRESSLKVSVQGGETTRLL
jgi:predicted adenylyl cyclase CyaB